MPNINFNTTPMPFKPNQPAPELIKRTYANLEEGAKAEANDKLDWAEAQLNAYGSSNLNVFIKDYESRGGKFTEAQKDMIYKIANSDGNANLSKAELATILYLADAEINNNGTYTVNGYAGRENVALGAVGQNTVDKILNMFKKQAEKSEMVIEKDPKTKIIDYGDNEKINLIL